MQSERLTMKPSDRNRTFADAVRIRLRRRWYRRERLRPIVSPRATSQSSARVNLPRWSFALVVVAASTDGGAEMFTLYGVMTMESPAFSLVAVLVCVVGKGEDVESLRLSKVALDSKGFSCLSGSVFVRSVASGVLSGAVRARR